MPTRLITGVRRLRAELDTLLHDLLALVEKGRGSLDAADFRALRACLFDIGELLASSGWQQEYRLLLPALAPAALPHRRLARLAGQDASRDLERLAELHAAVTELELLGPRMHARLELLVLLFVEWHFARRELFEREIVPLARARLNEAAWARLEALARQGSDAHPKPRRMVGARTASRGCLHLVASPGDCADALLRRRLVAQAMRRCGIDADGVDEVGRVEVPGGMRSLARA